jgi:glycosyltransferase involved in cell wall biosynthesis
VLVVHNAYQIRGGEDVVVQNEIELLRAHGHTVDVWLSSNESINGWLAKVVAAAGMVFSLPSYFRMRAILRRARPDVVHVHNFFPLVSPSVFFACARARVPVVLTLHNYRILCPTATLSLEGRVAEQSLTEGPWWAVKHAVYRGSRLGTFMLAAMISVHNRVGTWSSKVTRFIALSPIARQKFVEGGIPPQRIVVKPNFVRSDSHCNESRGKAFLYVGRLSPEKGVDILLQAVQEERWELRVAGGGPLELSATDGVVPLGVLEAHDIKTEMARASALVVPSIWHETFGMVVIEAFAQGTPVIASRIGALQSLVEDGVTGLLFEPGDVGDLREKMRWAAANPELMSEMGHAARKKYEESFSPERNYEELVAVYRAAITEIRSKIEGTA